jgi:UDP-N-acetylmuramoylalanine--D-glutamate ligase
VVDMDWKGKRVVILGAARQGTALARYLSERGAWVVLNDQRQHNQLLDAVGRLSDLDLEWVFGGHPNEVLDGADLVCPSGGVPLDLPIIQEALKRGIPLSNDSQIFLETAPCKVIGITGSAGKTTTTSLVGRMAQAATQMQEHTFIPRRVWVGGNIGNPLLLDVDAMQPQDLAVVELSSFQLEVMCSSPQVAAVLNITPNHLDRHGTMEAYIAAKRRILAYQKPGQPIILGRNDPTTWSLAENAQGSAWSFGHTLDGGGEIPGTYLAGEAIWAWDTKRHTNLLPITAVNLRGDHNLMNVLAACAICAAVGLPSQAIRLGVEGFAGVPHRLELIRTWGGADWFNDSIATAPERAMAAIRSFTEPIVLLAGGRDKNLPWKAFAELVRSRVDHLVLFGEAAPIITQALQDASKNHSQGHLQTLTVCKGLKEAVEEAAKVIQPGDVVLLSPGGTSFDEFRDFEERGEAFRKWVLEL